MHFYETRVLKGSYQSYTERAVQKFREQYQIYGDDMKVYNNKMAGELADVVPKQRSEGHMFI